jgi:hypothetical protein
LLANQGVLEGTLQVIFHLLLGFVDVTSHLENILQPRGFKLRLARNVWYKSVFGYNQGTFRAVQGRRWREVLDVTSTKKEAAISTVFQGSVA